MFVADTDLVHRFSAFLFASHMVNSSEYREIICMSYNKALNFRTSLLANEKQNTRLMYNEQWCPNIRLGSVQWLDHLWTMHWDEC